MDVFDTMAFYASLRERLFGVSDGLLVSGTKLGNLVECGGVMITKTPYGVNIMDTRNSTHYIVAEIGFCENYFICYNYVIGDNKSIDYSNPSCFDDVSDFVGEAVEHLFDQ